MLRESTYTELRLGGSLGARDRACDSEPHKHVRHDFARQHARLGAEPRLDADSKLRNAVGLVDHANEARLDAGRNRTAELSRWCLRHLDGLTDTVSEARRRKAARPEKPLSLDANVGKMRGYDSAGELVGYVKASDRGSFDAWQREEYSEPKRRWSIEQWKAFEASLTDLEYRTLLLIGAEIGARRERGSGRAVGRLMGCDEKMIRKRRESAARKLWRAGIAYAIRGEVSRGPLWVARREAPSVRLKVRNAPIDMGEALALPAFSLPV